MQEAGLDADAVRGVLDLCLECRACKSECPVNVDVGRYKSEFLARYWAEHGTPLKARAFGYVDEIAGWGSRFAPIANRLATSTMGRRLAEATVGLDRRRTPPLWAATHAATPAGFARSDLGPTARPCSSRTRSLPTSSRRLVWRLSMSCRRPAWVRLSLRTSAAAAR